MRGDGRGGGKKKLQGKKGGEGGWNGGEKEKKDYTTWQFAKIPIMARTRQQPLALVVYCTKSLSAGSWMRPPPPRADLINMSNIGVTQRLNVN